MIETELTLAPEPSVNKQRDGRHTYQLPKDSLSPREMEVCLLLAEGVSAKNIASQLKITISTADSHTGNIFYKLGIHSRSELFKKYPSIEPIGAVDIARAPGWIRRVPRACDAGDIFKKLKSIEASLETIKQLLSAQRSR